MMRLLLIIMALLPPIFAFSADKDEIDTPYMERVAMADSAINKEDWPLALDLLHQAILIEPENPGNIMLMSNIGMLEFNLGQDSLAIQTLNEAHRRAPKSVTILSNRARVLTALGAESEALDDYNRVMELDSTQVSARFNHGLLSLRLRKYRDARADFDYMTAHFPDAYETKLGNATMYCAVGEYAAAIPYYSDLLDKHKEPEFYGARAFCRLQTGDLDGASDDIGRALELDPDDGELYLYRAALNKMRYMPDDARRDAQRAVDLGIDPARAAEFLK